MRALTSKATVLGKLKKHNLISDGHTYYLSDFHKSKVSSRLAEQLIHDRILEPAKAVSNWFEKEWKLRKPVGTHNGVEIFRDIQLGIFFFTISKQTYVYSDYQVCTITIDHLLKND